MKSSFRRRKLTPQLMFPKWALDNCDTNITWFLRVNDLLPDDFPHFGACGNDDFNLIWHKEMLLRTFLDLPAPSGDRYDMITEEEIYKSKRYGTGFERPSYKELIAWYYMLH